MTRSGNQLERPVDYGVKRSFWLQRGAGSLVFVAIATAMLVSSLRSDGPARANMWMAIAGLLFFGTAFVVCLMQGLRRKPRLTLDARGVLDRTLGVGVIAWSDIRQAGVYWIAQQPFISLRVHDAAKYAARASGFRRLLIRLNGGTKASQLTLNLAGLDADPEQVVQQLHRMRRSAGDIAPLEGLAEEEHELDGSEEEIDIAPPSAQRVLHRAIVLMALSMRSTLEDEHDVAEARSRQRRLRAWLEEVGASSELERFERLLLEAEIGALAPQQAIDASWGTEGAVVLAWAIGRVQLPPFDRPCDPSDLAERLGMLAPPSSGEASLRSESEVEALGRKLFTIHWRLREYSLRPERLDFRAVAARTRFGLEPDGLPLVEGDLAIDGAPLSTVPEHRWREVLGIAGERHRGVNWLLGFERLYSDVTADT